MTAKIKRCEPCDHAKKICSKCRDHICLNDFATYSTLLGTKRPECKDCENKIRNERRQRNKWKKTQEIFQGDPIDHFISNKFIVENKLRHISRWAY